MTDNIFTNKDSALQNHRFPGVYQEGVFPQQWTLTSQNGNLSIPKRQTLCRWRNRIAASGFAGSDLAIEYVYGKYVLIFQQC